MTERKTITVADFLTPEEIKRCIQLYTKLADSGTFASTVDKEVITPNMAGINKALGQENDARYLAYCVEYAMMQAREK